MNTLTQTLVFRSGNLHICCVDEEKKLYIARNMGIGMQSCDLPLSSAIGWLKDYCKDPETQKKLLTFATYHKIFVVMKAV